MHALIVLAHPEAKSFNAQMAHVAKETLEAEGWTAEISDLYRQGFDPCEGPSHFASRKIPDQFSAQTEQRHAADTDTIPPEVLAEVEKLERADLVIFQFPMWWFSTPAILKGWLDRCLVYGRTYTGSMRYDRGYFMGKRAILSVSTGAPASTHGCDGRNGDADMLLWPFHYSLHYVGFTVLPPFYSFSVESGIIYSDPSVLHERLEGYKTGLAEHLRGVDKMERIPFNGWDDWDEEGKLKPDAPAYSPFMRHPD